MRATEKNSTDSAMGRRPVSVARRTTTDGHFVVKLEMACFDWLKYENSLHLVRITVPRYLNHYTVILLEFQKCQSVDVGDNNLCSNVKLNLPIGTACRLRISRWYVKLNLRVIYSFILQRWTW